MANRTTALVEITPEVLLKAYACGIFPMAEAADDPALYWVEPEKRGIIPLEGFHIPARLARTGRVRPPLLFGVARALFASPLFVFWAQINERGHAAKMIPSALCRNAWGGFLPCVSVNAVPLARPQRRR